MKRMNLRKTLGAAILIGGTIVGASALADPPQDAYGHGYGMGGGMMGGYGMGGDGMMGGYGMGPGMMDGQGPRLRHGVRHDGRLRLASRSASHVGAAQQDRQDPGRRTS